MLLGSACCGPIPVRQHRGVDALADDAEKRLREERAKFADFGLLAAEGADLDQLLHQAATEAA